MNKIIYAFVVASNLVLVDQSLAKETLAVATPRAMSDQCMAQTVTVNISFNNLKGQNFADVKKQIDDQKNKIAEYAKQQKIEKMNVQNENYSINASASYYDNMGNAGNFIYNGSGNISYLFDNLDVATKFGEFLTTQKIQVSLNYNSYNRGNCQNTPTD